MSDDPKYFHVGQPVYVLTGHLIVTGRVCEQAIVKPTFKLSPGYVAQPGDPYYKVEIVSGFGVEAGLFGFISSQIFSTYDEADKAWERKKAEAEKNCDNGEGHILLGQETDEQRAMRRNGCGKPIGPYYFRGLQPQP